MIISSTNLKPNYFDKFSSSSSAMMTSELINQTNIYTYIGLEQFKILVLESVCCLIKVCFHVSLILIEILVTCFLVSLIIIEIFVTCIDPNFENLN